MKRALKASAVPIAAPTLSPMNTTTEKGIATTSAQIGLRMSRPHPVSEPGRVCGTNNQGATR